MSRDEPAGSDWIDSAEPIYHILKIGIKGMAQDQRFVLGSLVIIDQLFKNFPEGLLVSEVYIQYAFQFPEDLIWDSLCGEASQRLLAYFKAPYIGRELCVID